MLHKETVEGTTFDLLKTIMQDEVLSGFSLAGGTALALYLGHRVSIDLDLFTSAPFDSVQLEKYLSDKYDFKGDFLDKNTLKGSIDGVKFDCITHDYISVEPLTIEEGVRLYSIQDIAAMKLSAIADNGTRLKDFIDVAYLSSTLSLTEMLDAYHRKYPNANTMRPLKGLTYFEDINFNEPIRLIKGDFKWNNIKARLFRMADFPKVVFQSPPLSEKESVGKRIRR